MLNSPSACRNGFPCETTGLKEVCSCALSHGPKGSLVDKVAAALDIKPGTLRDAVNPNEPDWPPSKYLDVVAAMTADHPVIAQHFAAIQGGFFYKVAGAADVDQLTAKSVREYGEFLQTISTGPITPALLARIHKEGAEAMAAIQAVIANAELRAAAVTR